MCIRDRTPSCALRSAFEMDKSALGNLQIVPNITKQLLFLQFKNWLSVRVKHYSNSTYSTIGQVSSWKHGPTYISSSGMIHCPQFRYDSLSTLHCWGGRWTTFCSFECHVVWISSVTRIWSEIKWTPISQHMIATRSKSHQKSPNITKNLRKLQQI